jgi:hypothetical protein
MTCPATKRGINMGWFRFSKNVCIAIFLTVAQTSFAQALDVGGIKFEATNSVAGNSVTLNGAGFRTRFVFKVYAGGLYLPTKTSNADAAIKMAGAKRIRLVFLRELDTNEFGKLFVAGVKRNSTPMEFLAMVNGTVEMGKIFSAAKNPLKPGDVVLMDYIPSKGTVITINERVYNANIIPEPEFYAGLMRVWLGKEPADATLKENMLGAPISSATRTDDR